MKTIVRTIMVLSLSFFALAVLAQQDAQEPSVQLGQSEEFGEYLTDGQGMTLYLFLDEEAAHDGADRMTEGVRDAAVSCTGECLGTWPAFFTDESEVQAGEGVDDELLYTAEFDGRMHVVYNGWPLFYFVRDEEPGQINGQGIESFGGEWYILQPDGQQLEDDEQAGERDGEGDVAGGGQADGGQEDADDGEAEEDAGQDNGRDDGQDDGQDGMPNGGNDDRY